MADIEKLCTIPVFLSNIINDLWRMGEADVVIILGAVNW